MNREPGPERPRRAVLRALGAAAVGGLAGCGQLTGSPSTDTPTATPTATPTHTPTSTATPAPTDDIDASARRLITTLAAGEYQAAADQFSSGVQVDAATLESVWTGLQRQAGTFVGIEGSERTTVSGLAAVILTVRFSQALQGIRVVFDQTGRPAGFQFVPVDQREEWSPPEYVRAEDIETTTVSVEGGACDLPGEVTVPASAATTGGSGVPSFVLLGGSGPTDLDGTIGPNKPYRDIAYGTATLGDAASLRYSKRTAVCSVDPATVRIDEEYTADAVAAVERLRAADGADPRRTAVVGHSLGAALAPRVATQVDGVAGVVLLAPPGRPLWELIVEQTRYLAELDGTVTDAEREQIDAAEEAARRIENLNIPEGETVFGGGRPYWESLQNYDAIATARELSVPILVLHGGRDYQVTETDMQAWRDGIGGQANVTFRTYESLNHLFMPGEGESSPSEYSTLDHVPKEVITDLGEWLAARWQE